VRSRMDIAHGVEELKGPATRCRGMTARGGAAPIVIRRTDGGGFFRRMLSIRAAGPVARWLEQRGVGVILRGDPKAALNSFLESCAPEPHASLRDAVMALDGSATTVSNDEAKAVLARLAGVAPGS
jgi:hypothetical protein